MEKVSVKDSSKKTVESIIGEMVWLLSQSPAHKFLTIADLEWFVMPPIMLRQFKIFRDESQKPVGFALWGFLDEQAEQKLLATNKLAPQDWGNNAQLDDSGMTANPGGQMWLIELLAPFHNDTNHHREQMVADLMGSDFKDKSVKTVKIDPATNQKEVVEL